MKKLSIALTLLLLLGTASAQAQVLKGFGKKLEKKLEDRVERKADRHVDRVIDKADKETDKPIEGVIEGKTTSKPKKDTAQETVGSADPSASKQQTAPNPAALSEGLIMIPGGNCSDFIWFKSGAFMEFETSDGKGKNLQTSRMKIVAVTQQDDFTTADVLASDDQGHEFEMAFKCAGDKMYMDFGALMQSAMQQAGQSGAQEAEIKRVMDNTEIDFGEGFMSFPKQMYPGQTLEEVTISLSSNPGPQISMEMTTSLTQRQVLAKETITTDAGSFECVKISGVRNTQIKVMGMNRKMDPVTEYTWFAPGIGVVKQEEYTKKGTLQSQMQLKRYSL